MVEASRISSYPRIYKPRITLTKQFPFTETLELGDKGQLDTVFEVDSEFLDMTDEGSEVKHITLTLKQAKILGSVKGRM
jgi:hypothetical protein